MLTAGHRREHQHARRSYYGWVHASMTDPCRSFVTVIETSLACRFPEPLNGQRARPRVPRAWRRLSRVICPPPPPPGEAGLVPRPYPVSPGTKGGGPDEARETRPGPSSTEPFDEPSPLVSTLGGAKGGPSKGGRVSTAWTRCPSCHNGQKAHLPAWTPVARPRQTSEHTIQVRDAGNKTEESMPQLRRRGQKVRGQNITCKR